MSWLRPCSPNCWGLAVVNSANNLSGICPWSKDPLCLSLCLFLGAACIQGQAEAELKSPSPLVPVKRHPSSELPEAEGEASIAFRSSFCVWSSFLTPLPVLFQRAHSRKPPAQSSLKVCFPRDLTKEKCSLFASYSSIPQCICKGHYFMEDRQSDGLEFTACPSPATRPITH